MSTLSSVTVAPGHDGARWHPARFPGRCRCRLARTPPRRTTASLRRPRQASFALLFACRPQLVPRGVCIDYRLGQIGTNCDMRRRRVKIDNDRLAKRAGVSLWYFGAPRLRACRAKEVVREPSRLQPVACRCGSSIFKRRSRGPDPLCREISRLLRGAFAAGVRSGLLDLDRRNNEVTK